MNIRHATDQDIPQIVALLKMSLGESLMPKSEKYWRWKHVDNPFGRSPVLVAEESGTLIGVRAFMRWEWTDGNQVYKAVRAVDTATHPEHQGKGIFKKLTLQLIDNCREQGVHFIFNTPNSQSRPGYLKMGWEDAGRLPIRIMPPNPFALIARRWFGPAPDASMQEVLGTFDAASLVEKNKKLIGDRLITYYKSGYLQWRYVQVPVADYKGILLEQPGSRELIIYRLKQSKAGVELRLTDYLGDVPTCSVAMMKQIRRHANAAGASFITIAGTNQRLSKGFLLNKGPIVTIRDVQYPAFSSLRQFHQWDPSLGDLELF